MVKNTDVAEGGGVLETVEQEIRPAVVGVGVGAAAVGDGVTEDGEAARGERRPGFDSAEEVPRRRQLDACQGPECVDSDL